jgi:transcriptional regulator with XRE-family HTH domain
VANLTPSLSIVIRRARDAAALTQEQLAERSSLTATYISLLERGKRNPTVNALDAIARALGSSASALVAEAERGHSRPRRQ